MPFEMRMSSIGSCIRALVAEKLGYEAIPDSPDSIRLMAYATRQEDVFADFFKEDTGFNLISADACPLCKLRYPTERERYGIHVELEHNGLLLLGHMDRIILTPDTQYQMEIKSMGRFVYPKFLIEGFDMYPKYAWQEASYLNATGLQGVYLVGNRDNGSIHKYNINYAGQSPNFAKFDTLTVTVTLSDIFNKMDRVADYVDKGVLPEGDHEVGSDGCRWCKYDYMCIKKATGDKKEIVEDRSLLNITKAYAKGKSLEKSGELMKAEAIEELMVYENKRNPNGIKEKFQVGNYAYVVYGGKKNKKWIDEKLAKNVLDKDVLKKIICESKPYDDLRVYLLKEKEKEA